MAKSAESFFTSLGFPPLPQTFWERSMLTQPRDREVVCHASAWDMDDKDDVRIKMCIKPTEEDLFTIYHELGHVYYYTLVQGPAGAVPGRRARRLPRGHRRHVALSMTPAYLQKIGLVGDGEAVDRRPSSTSR